MAEKVETPKQETEEGQFVESSQIIGSNQEFSNYNEVAEDYNKISMQTKSQQKFKNVFSGFRKKRTFNATIETMKEITPEEARMLPNQLKAVINGQSDSTRKNFISNGNDLLAHPSTKNFFEIKTFLSKKLYTQIDLKKIQMEMYC